MYLVNLDSIQSEKATRLLTSLSKWAKAAESDVYKYNEAIDAINTALAQTTKYVRHTCEGGNRDAQEELCLEQLWFEASSKMRPYDPNLADLCMVKGYGWADPTVWSRPEHRDLPIRLSDMLMHLRSAAKKRPHVEVIPNWFPVAGAAFTFLALASLFFLIISPAGVSSDRRIIFDVWVAFCVAASVSFIGGAAHAHGQLPWIGDTPIKFLAYGGVGVFVVCLTLMYSIYH